MGGKSKSSTSSTNYSTTSTNTTADYRTTESGILEGNIDASGLDNSQITINKSDYGAIEAAGDFAESAAELGNNALLANYELAKITADQSGEFLTKGYGFAEDALKLSLDELDQTNQHAADQIKSALDYSTAVIKVGNQTEAANLTEAVINMAPKVLIILGVAYVGSKALRAR